MTGDSEDIGNCGLVHQNKRFGVADCREPRRPVSRVLYPGKAGTVTIYLA